jgi:glycosyltransferase involved in cell wall biosynthesis/SAM-dependent methyltransferase
MPLSRCAEEPLVKALSETWDEVARHYDLEIGAAERELAGEIARLIEGTGLRPPARIIEVGAGSGHLSLVLQESGYDTTLLDFSRVALEHARATYDAHGYGEEANRTRFILGDALNLSSITPDGFDLAWNSGVAEHFDAKRLERMLRGMAGLAPNVLVIVPNPESLFYLAGRRRLTVESKWIYGVELLRRNYADIFQAAGLRQVRRGFLGRTMTRDWIRLAVGKEAAPLFESLLDEGQIPSRELYLEYFFAKVEEDPALAESATASLDDLDSEAIDRTLSIDALGTAMFSLSKMQYELDNIKTKSLKECEDLHARLQASQAEAVRAQDELRAELQQAQAEADQARDKLAKERTRAQAAEHRVIHLTAAARHVATQLRELQISKAWRLAKLVRFLNSTVISGALTGRFEAVSRLARRTVSRGPLLAFDHVGALAAKLEGSVSKVAVRPSLSIDMQSDRSRHVMLTHRTGAVCGVPDLVSIVMPVFNHADLLPEAVRGVQAQTWRDWELIIVDDGSKDDFDAALKPFLGDARIRVFRQPNQKLPSALNNGFREARGEYLTWTSADNIMLPNQIERLVRALEEDSTVGLVYSDYEAIDDRGMPLSDPAFRPHNRLDGSARIRLPKEVSLKSFHESKDNFLGASFMYRAEVAAIVGRYDEHTFGGEDYDFWLRAHLVTPFRHVDENLYRYRVHDNTLNAKAHELDLFENIRNLLQRDVARRRALLSNGSLRSSMCGCLRDPSQYGRQEQEWVAYSALAVGGQAKAAARTCVVDVPLREVEPSQLQGFDVVLTPDELTFRWLKSQELGAGCRLLCGDPVSLAPAIAHCLALRRFERDQAQAGRPFAAKSPAKLHPSAAPRHVLLLVEAWRSGGLENVVLDLARGLAGRGIRTTIGLAAETPPEALLEALAGQPDLAAVGFDGDETALGAFIRGEGIDLASLHHTVFGLGGTLDEVPTAYTFHSSYIWFNEAKRLQWRNALQHADISVAVSRQVAAYNSWIFGLDASRVGIVPNGVDLPADVGDNPAESANFRFVSIASFNRIKMLDALVKAFSMMAERYPDTTLTLVGAPLDKRYLQEIKRTSLPLGHRIEVVPGLPRTDALQKCASADAFVLPSAIEGWSLAATEAAMLGLPIVGTDVGALRDLRSAGAAIVLVPPLDRGLVDPGITTPESAAERANALQPPPWFVDELAGALERAIAQHSELRKQALFAAATIKSLFSVDAMTSNYVEQFALARFLHTRR